MPHLPRALRNLLGARPARRAAHGHPAAQSRPPRAPIAAGGDAFHAWTYAANCVLHEQLAADDNERASVARVYALHLLLHFDADAARLTAAAAECQREAAALQVTRTDFARELVRAADLCDTAAVMVGQSLAADGDRGRRRLLAVAEHDTRVAWLGAIDGVSQDARAVLDAALAALDAEPDPLADLPPARPYAGPTYDRRSGRLHLADSSAGAVYWRLDTPGERVDGGLICGPEQSGKTNVLRIIALEALHEPKFALWYADPAARHQPSALADAAHRAATDHRSSVALLRAAAELVAERTTARQLFGASPEHPGVLVMLEDCHRLFGDDLEAAALAEHIACDGGPAGVALIATARDTALASFGGSQRLRDALARTNLCALGPDGARMAAEVRETR